MGVKKIIFIVVLFVLFGSVCYAKTCSETWGFDCSTGPPETGGGNTFDGCSYGAGGGESVDEIYINASSVYHGDSINVTCEFDPFVSGDDLYIWYYNGSGWRSLYFESNTGSSTNMNRSVVFTPDNITGVHWVRCSIDYGMNDQDGCADTGTYYDNDDINFTVEEEEDLLIFSGYVFDSDGNPLADVPLEFDDIWLMNKTDANGYFEFTNLSKGLYGIDINEGDERWPALEQYTIIEFEGEGMINLTDDLEINATLYKIGAELRLNTTIFENGGFIEGNITVKNNEAFDLINWLAVLIVYYENETYDEELSFDSIKTNLSAGEERSYMFTYEVPNNNTYSELIVFGGIGNDNWGVVSSQGNLTALIYKADEEEIFRGVRFDINLLKGWNLISFPLNFTNITEIFEPIKPYFGAMFGYDGSNQKFIEVDPYDNVEIDLGYGIWLNVSHDITLSVVGEEFDNVAVDLFEGWNLIGFPSLNSSLVNETLKDVNYSVVYGYNNTNWISYVKGRNDSLNTLERFVPGYGYWVKANENVSLGVG